MLLSCIRYSNNLILYLRLIRGTVNAVLYGQYPIMILSIRIKLLKQRFSYFFNRKRKNATVINDNLYTNYFGHNENSSSWKVCVQQSRMDKKPKFVIVSDFETHLVPDSSDVLFLIAHMGRVQMPSSDIALYVRLMMMER